MIMHTKKRLKLMIVDDHAVVRVGLRSLLENQGSLQVVGEAANAAEAVEKALRLQPDIVLMDVRLPDESGVEACRKIRSANPRIRVLMLTSYSDDEAVFSSVMAGASGYLLKGLEVDELYQAVIDAGNGNILMDAGMTQALQSRIKEICASGPGRGIDSLTAREKDILQLIASGLTNREIADKICISEKTVRNNVTAIFQKLDVSHRTEAAVFYLKRNPPKE